MHDKYIEILPQISDIRVLEDMFKYSRVTLQGESVKAIALADSLFDRADELSKTSLLVDKTKAVEYYNLSKQVCLFLAPHLFDRYCIYLEWDREPKKRFYLPRRKVLKVVADDMQDLYDGKIDFLSVSLPPRVGKLLANETPVLTKKGWKTHGALEVGDYVVSPEGKYVRVEHVFSKDYANMKVTMSNGESFLCHENHEWKVYDKTAGSEKIRETKKMYDILQNHADDRCYFMMPPREPMLGEEKDLPVAPYTLGVWLGDGTSKTPRICKGLDDIWIITEGVKEEGYSVTSTTIHKDTGVIYVNFGKLRFQLQEFGMCKSRQVTEKYIPDIYFTASLEQRLKLLAGLLDTDGTFRKKENRYAFSTTSERIKDGFVKLIGTFGWRTCVKEDEPKVSSSGVIGRKKVYTIGFNPTFTIPCRLPRKQQTEFSTPRRIGIRSIEYLDKPVEGNCIQVEGGMYCVGKTMIPTHNSTLGCFYMSWLMGKHPELSSLMVGYSDKLTKGFYREVYNIIADDAVYLWRTIFPENVIVGVSAEDESISINAKRRYPTLTCRSISGSLTGIIDITLCLYCDDLISDLEEAINPNRLQSKYDAYANQLKDRMKLNSFQLMIGTRWSPNDVQGVIEEMYRDNPKYRFRVIPALDDNGNSNFDYPYELGFTTEHFLDIKKSVDAASWSSKYMGNPSPREGLLYPEEDLKYYNGTLPDGNYVVWSACDIAWGGGDHLSQGFLYVFENGDVYVHDVVHNPGDKGITKPLVVAKMIEHQPAFTCFEANNGGHEYADDIERILRTEHGVLLKIESRKAPTTSSKLVRMLGGAVTARNWYFRDRSCRNDEYKLFMRHLTQFNQAGIGKQPDDAPDMLSQAERFIFHGATKVEVFQRPI